MNLERKALIEKNVPSAIQNEICWVCWKQEMHNGKVTKVPYSAITGLKASVADPSSWATFTEVLGAASKYGYDGVGFVFNGGKYCGTDIDHCIDKETGEISDFAKEIVLELDSYTERSPSKLGLHIITAGKLPSGGRKNTKIGLEMYEKGRFFTITGDAIDDAHMEVEERTLELAAIHERYLKKQDKSGTKAVQKSHVFSEYINDDEIIQKASNASNGELFKALMNGAWKGRYQSQSEADIALCNLLAFWFRRDDQLIDKWFKQSGLYREKWDERHGELTYGQITIRRACNDIKEVYEPGRKGVHNSIKPPEAPELDLGYDQLYGPPVDEPRVKKSLELPEWYYADPKGNIKFIPIKLAQYLVSSRYDFFVGDNFYKWEPYKYDASVNKHSGGVFKKYPISEASLIVQSYMSISTSITNRNIREVLDRWKERSSRYPEKGEIDFNKNLINLKNGIYDILNDILIPHDHKYYSTIQLNFSYDLNAQSLHFEKWLKEMQWPENIDCLWEQIGYAFTMHADQKKLFLHYSPSKGNSGKGTFMRVIERLIGYEYCSSVGWAHLDDRFAMAQLYRKLVNIDGDIPAKPISADMSKKLTGMDAVPVEEKGKPTFSARLFVKLFYSCNELPHQIDSTDANFMRIMITSWDKKYLSDSELDRGLEDRFISDFDYIGTKALHEGLQRLLRNGKFSESNRQKSENEGYRQVNDSLNFFIQEECLTGENYCVKRSEFYAAYCKSTRYPKSPQKVYDDLQKKGFVTKDITRGLYAGRYLIGITLSECQQTLPVDKRLQPNWLKRAMELEEDIQPPFTPNNSS